ncbi:hypothetical protein AN618_21340 [Fervidicola ferrireducens]|uniref:Uncharacterized protein n=1 Tax=Fervidicola ferrireducens TaxID=520764 RepID=A0A140L2Y4_9FIRM|nr:hypothetical protein [Fervidicola ferrireducens]KXG74909.1 hypothetical protein AN618_21340 [Fervidicola ferrireducens]
MKKLAIVFLLAFMLALGYMLHFEFVRELFGVAAAFMFLFIGLALIVKKAFP